MKKLLFAAAVMCCGFITKTSAQFIFGPEVGFNYATLTKTDFTINPKPEWHAGLLFDLGFAKHLSLQPSVLYSRRGYKYDYNTSSTSYVSTDTSVTTVVAANVDAKLGYIDIPVLLSIYFGDHRGFMLNAGPQLSILLTNQSVATSTVTTSTNGGTPQTTQPETETDFKVKPTDISLAAGIGYKLPALLMVYARAVTGFGRVLDDKTIVKDGREGRHFTIEVGAALTFGSK